MKQTYTGYLNVEIFIAAIHDMRQLFHFKWFFTFSVVGLLAHFDKTVTKQQSIAFDCTCATDFFFILGPNRMRLLRPMIP